MHPSPFLTRRTLLRTGCASLLAAPTWLRAQRPEQLRIVVGFPPGGVVDLVARKLAEKLAGRVAAQVLVDNKPGAAGRIAAEEVKKAAPGSTVLLTPSSVMAMYPHVYRQLTYDPFADFAPVTTAAATGFALAVGPGMPAQVDSTAALVGWAQAGRSPVACGNAGAGSMPHFLSLVMARQLGIQVTPVPYRGGQAAMQAAAAGEAPMALGTENGARSFQQAGRLRVLATTWAQRSPFLPDVPTFRELGIDGLVVREWFGLFMPVRTPDDLVQAVARAVQAVVVLPDVKEVFETLSIQPEALAPERLRESLRAEHESWAPVVKASGFTPES